MSVVDERVQRTGEDRRGEYVQLTAHLDDDTLGEELDTELETVRVLIIVVLVLLLRR
jgi:hypothetical protein